MHMSQHTSPKTFARIKRIQGQLGALQQAMQQGNDCEAVLQQIAAIRGAVNGLMNEVLAAHMQAHLGAAADDAQTRQHDLDTVMQVIARYLK